MRIRPSGSVAASSRSLTVKEQALWTLQSLFPNSGVSNEAIAFAVPGRVDPARLRGQVARLVSRHAALRTVFPELHGEPVAVVLNPADVVVEVSVIDSPDDKVEDAMADFAAAPFDLSGETPLRVGLWRGAEGDACCLALHHLAYDAQSAALMIADLVDGYNAATAGEDVPPHLLGTVPRAVEPSPDAAAMAYWRAQVRGVDPGRQRLAMGRPDPDQPSFAGASRVHELSHRARTAVTSLARRHQVTEPIVLLSAYYLLLARHGAGADPVVGVLVDVREPTSPPAVGYHVNTLPVRAHIAEEQTARELLRGVGTSFLSGMSHRAVPYEAVLPELDVAGSAWRTPLFRYTFNCYSEPLPSAELLSGLQVDVRLVRARHSRQDLEFRVETGPGGRRIRAVYSSEIFDEADIRALQDRYDALLVVLADHGDRPLAEIDWWSVEDHVTVAVANDTADASETPQVIESVFDNAERTPDRVAIVDGAAEHTYAELVAAAADVRDRLVAIGLGAGSVVAVQARRGGALAAAVLGVWAAGAAYLPLHPEHPPELCIFQLNDSGAAAVLTDRALPEGVGSGLPVLSMTDPGTVPATRQGSVAVSATLPAYVIYTSGSTGWPKGVQVTHDNLANLITDFRHRLRTGPAHSALWLTTFAFDISALELFLPLVSGGRVVVAPDAAHGDPRILLDLVTRHDVRVVQATPTTWASVAPVAAADLAGRNVLCGGEPLTSALAEQLVATGCHLSNVYGPTETTIWSTVAEIGSGAVSVGVPLRNTTVFVAGPDGAALPPGVVGELCIAGRGVAMGYTGRPELTADRFCTAGGVGRYYRTGDRARWSYDGQLDLLGRTDRQVKIRAHRLELGEVEAALVDHPSVATVAAVLHEDLPADGRLVAFVQWAGAPAAGAVDELWRHARKKLASYALPNRIVPGPLALTGSGKIDYRALARRPLRAPAASPVPVDSGHDLVAEVIELWREVLDDPTVGPDDNFFLSGGHSLHAARILARLSMSTGIGLTLGSLLNAPTARKFADHLATMAG